MKSQPKFLADHDLNEHFIDGLLRRQPMVGITRLRAHRLHEQPDETVLQFAAKHDLVVLSHDVNTMPAAYARIAAEQPLPGLIMIKQTDSVAEVIEDLLLIWSASEASEWSGQVWFLPI